MIESEETTHRSPPCCPKCGAYIHDDEPAYVMEPYAAYVCEACWRGTSRAYRRYDPAESYLQQKLKAQVTLMGAVIIISILVFVMVVLLRWLPL